MSVNHRRIVRFAEYLAISASVVGAIATFKTQRPIFVAAPLTLFAGLSLISRHQQSQQINQLFQQSAQQTETAQLQIKQLQKQLEAAEKSELSNQQPNQIRLDILSEKIAEQSAVTATLVSSIETINRKVEQQTNEQIAQIETGNNTIKAVNSRIATVENAFNQVRQLLATNISDTQQKFETIRIQAETKLEQLTSHAAGLQQQIESQATSGQKSQISEEATDNSIAQVEDMLQTLKQELEARLVQLEKNIEHISKLPVAETLVIEPPELKPPEPETIEVQLPTPPLETRRRLDFSHVVPQLPTADNFDLDVNLGIDFGTGYTKVCFRDLARDRSEVVTFVQPDETDLTLDKTLIPTRLAILQDGTVLTGLTVAEWNACKHPIQTEINYIKMRLAAIDFRQDSKEDEWRLDEISELDDDETVESLCAYYLSNVIKRAQQWIMQHRPELFTNQTVRWSVNIGVPVEYCDSPALARFQRVLALAWLLKSTSVETASLTIAELNQLMTHLQQWMGNNNISKDDLDCFTTPEIAAAVWSFLNSRQAQEGFYTFFDIGDGTLDGAAFIFKQADGHRQVDFYSGQVEPLGVTAFVEKTADELRLSSDDIRQSLSDTSDRALQEKMQRSHTRRKVQQLVASVVMEGNEKHHQTRQYSVNQDIGEKLKVFVGGGGSSTAFFPRTIHATHSEFNHSNADIPPYEIREIPPPSDLSINGLDTKDFNRFAIAYGLCIPDGEGPIVQLPSQFETIEIGGELSDYEPECYEDTRDAM